MQIKTINKNIPFGEVNSFVAGRALRHDLQINSNYYYNKEESKGKAKVKALLCALYQQWRRETLFKKRTKKLSVTHISSSHLILSFFYCVIFLSSPFSPCSTMASKNAVKVFVRTKPTSNFAHDMINILDDNKTINIKLKKKEGYINNQQETWGFAFDEVMNNTSQDEVYERCGAAVTQSVLDGYLINNIIIPSLTFILL